MTAGRPPEGRVKLTLYVLRETRARIKALVHKGIRSHDQGTAGKIVDRLASPIDSRSTPPF